jgi:hypothetical protein
MVRRQTFPGDAGDGPAGEGPRDSDRAQRARQLFRALRAALLGPEPAAEPTPLPAECVLPPGTVSETEKRRC